MMYLIYLQEDAVCRVVDGVLEDIRLGMELNEFSINQRRVSMIKYLGELYNYRILDSSDILRVSKFVKYTVIGYHLKKYIKYKLVQYSLPNPGLVLISESLD